MLSIEEYISKPKKEDGINEFDIKSLAENTRICVNYAFEYFNNYLPMDELEERTVLKSEKTEKFRKRLDGYSPAVCDWLVNMFDEYGKQMHIIIGNSIRDDLFLIYNQDSEFRSVSYDCYSLLIKRFSFLKGQTEMLFSFIKDYHAMKSNKELPCICDELNQWLNGTLTKFGVNMSEFAFQIANDFYGSEDTWPRTHRLKSQYDFRKYDYDFRQKVNLFNIDSLYRKLLKKAFIKGRKQEIEALIMYHWLHDMEGDDSGYWDEYLLSVSHGFKTNGGF